MISTVTNQNLFEFRGLSTDTKPIGNNCANKNADYLISNGSSYFEMDTSEVYMLSITNNVGTWVKL